MKKVEIQKLKSKNKSQEVVRRQKKALKLMCKNVKRTFGGKKKKIREI